MTAQILAAELGNLIQDSKRKNTELRTAADKALQDLKSLPVTSETQLSADLSRRPHFISPFLIACNTHNAKFGSTGVSCLQRLTVARALPRERLSEVIEALRESVTLSHDVQLKILQALPSLIQNYPTEIRGDSLSTILQTCSALQNAKNFAVSNTAAATLQQLVIAVFDRVAIEDEKALEIPTVTEVPRDDGSVAIRPAAYDAYKVFNDLNLLVTGEKTAFIRFSSLPSTSTLEVIEAVLSNHSRIMATHAEQIHILRSLLMPTIIRSLSDRLSFPITLRIIRIVNLLIRNHLDIMPSECEIALGLLNHMLDPQASTSWKRALCLEFFRGIYLDPRLLLQIYSLYDEQKGKKNIFGDNLASFVRLAIEKPTLIGLSQQSTLPITRTEGGNPASEQAVAEAGALAGVIGGPSAETNSAGHPAGISIQWSTLKTPCIEHLDKSEPPHLPETYVYGLVLTCITNVSESLAKFVLPLTVHQEGKTRKKSRTDENLKLDSDAPSPTSLIQRRSRTQSFRRKTVPVNPLALEDHSAYAYVKTSATLVAQCWPAVLATCSTFLNAALDAEYYRALVRAVQKFTQVAGLLRLSTPRDAFLTTLGKAAVPSNMLLASVASPKSPPTEHTGMFSNAKGLLSVDSLVSQASSALDKNRRPSHDVNLPTLGPRNLLCLRALLNLAIALGPTLQSAWSIVFETLQVADLVLAMSKSTVRTPFSSGAREEPESSLEKVEAETSAVQAAARRLFESTVDFPNDAFKEVLQALCVLIHHSAGVQSGDRTPTNNDRPTVLHQRRLGSVSSMSLNTNSSSRDSAFALNKIGELAALNEERLAHYEPADSGWNIFVTELVSFSADDRKPTSTRLLSADILSRTVREIAELSISDDERDAVQARILSALQAQISALHHDYLEIEDPHSDTDIRIHQISLEALKSVIEQCGESLVTGWISVFDSLLSVFAPSTRPDRNFSISYTSNGHGDVFLGATKVISKSLARTAFNTVQLVCSDFLAAVPDNSVATLLELLVRFSCQQDDLNMSLTTVTFFWNVSDFLHTRSDLSGLPDILGDVHKLIEVRQAVQRKSHEGSIAAMWLQVLLDLTAVTTDKRAELRNSAIQTIQRIFENYADQLSSDVWVLCLRSVLFGTIESNIIVQNNLRNASWATNEDTAAWNETTKAILDSVSALILLYMDKIEDVARLGEAWSDLLEYYRQYFECGSHALGFSVFTTMTTVLSRIQHSRVMGLSPLLKTATIWKDYLDHREAWQDSPESNQDAFVAYAEAFKAIYRLTDQALATQDVTKMLGNLEICIVDSDEVPYSSDVDHMTALQKLVIECYSTVYSERPGLPEFLIRALSKFVVLPYASAVEPPAKRGPTFVALAKASMGLLQDTIVKHVTNHHIYSSGVFLSAVTSLTTPIRQKYIWQQEGKPPTIWQKATTTAVSILEPSLTQINRLDGEQRKAIWEQIVQLASSVTRAHISSNVDIPSLEKDETFDITSFTKLRGLATLCLGSSCLPDSLRRKYTRNLFETSILHEPYPGEIPDLADSPLEGLYKVRLGRTDEPQMTVRREMAYVCLSELFSLLSVQDSSPERIKLAQATAPYLILRATLPLRAYIADHPLRGRMPQPESQRRELLYVLQELERLKSEPVAIPDAPGVKSKHRKHLHRMYPLLVKAARVAKRDGEVFATLIRLMDLVGSEFGVSDE